ncbi:MAG: sn-glycerol-3-phosphate import ATP-binding protein UgpC [SAR324 cluster bacterium]|nr:sn-glycerol-3-phosphate import ATP-binding protein UgpC [SAR324 cluster bacterium]MBL7006713.1 sn-glycerol-3-phosphate import ATP-binding protein UgpC [Spirochaetia bacterium]
MATVSIKNAIKTYPGNVQALHGISIDIKDGELIVIVGPSGCGKSTMLRMVAGLETVTSGDIHINEEWVNKKEPADRDIAMVFQNYALYPHMSVYQNMAYGLKNRKIPKDQIEQRVRETAKILELENLLVRKPKELSGGQRQRVAMGRAIVREPKVFLFDEPLSNLDAKLRVQMRLEIKRLQERLGVTTIYVTHDQVEAMTLGHRLLLMNEGRVEQIGTPLEVYEKPQTLFVAGFIGSPSMNIIPAVLSSNGDLALLGDSLSLPLTHSENSANSDSQVTLGMRPEHLEACESEKASMFLQVEMLEKLGADTVVYGKLEQTELVLTVRLSGIHPVVSGDRLPLTIPSEHLHIFEIDSGKRLN